MTNYPMGWFTFKLRYNIPLEGDLRLARREIEAFVGSVEPVARLTATDAFIDMTAYTRPNGVQGYRVRASIGYLPALIRRLSFVQTIYVITADSPAVRHILHDLATVCQYRTENDQLFITAIPHYALFELSEVIARKTPIAAEIGHNLARLRDTLLGCTDDKVAHPLADSALHAKMTSGHLFHDLHYYKAKFFPRMARFMLNICAQSLDIAAPHVLDPFVGSGTTLLEAALMGMPAIGIDLDPLSVLIARTKLDVMRLDLALLERESVRIAMQLTQSADARLTSSRYPPIVFPPWLLRNRAMDPQTAAQLSAEINGIRAVIDGCDEATYDLLRVLLSDALSRRIRMRFIGTGVGRFALTFSRNTLADIFLKSLGRIVRTLIAWVWLRDTLGLQPVAAHVEQGDARQLDGLGPFDVVITSPPYLPASSGRETYTKARAPSLIALGMTDDVDGLASEAIGSMDSGDSTMEALTDKSRALVEWLLKDDLRAIKAPPIARYFLDMRASFSAIHRVLRPGGLSIIVSGKQSAFYRYRTREMLYSAPIADMLAEEARHAGLEVIELLDVPLNKSNRHARPRALDEYAETLIILRRSDSHCG